MPFAIHQCLHIYYCLVEIGDVNKHYMVTMLPYCFFINDCHIMHLPKSVAWLEKLFDLYSTNPLF